MRNIRTGMILCVAVIAIADLSAAETSFVENKEDAQLDTIVDGKPRVRYMFAFDESDPDKRFATGKPFHHILAPDGKSPITNEAGPGVKFPHHRGLFIGWSKLTVDKKRYDTWHVRNTSLVHQKFVEPPAVTDGKAVAKSEIHWLSDTSKDSAPLVREIREVTVHDTDDAYVLLDFTSALTALAGDVDLDGDPEHAGIQYRPHNDLAKSKGAKYIFHKEGINPRKDKDLPWVALTYKLGDETYTVQHMSHPDNPGDAVYSAYRDYGRFGEFFKHEIKKNETATFKYRLRITLGAAPTREQMQAAYDAYVR